MQFTNILLSLAAVAGVINAAPAPYADVKKIFSYQSCMTTTYDTPEGTAFYDIDGADVGNFEANCKTCMEATVGCDGGDAQCIETRFAECAKKFTT